MSTSRWLTVMYTVLIVARHCGYGCLPCLNGDTRLSDCSCVCTKPWFGRYCDDTESPANLTFLNGTIRSPGYRIGRYRNRELFDWFISPVHVSSLATVQLIVESMELESGYDYLEIFTDPPKNSKIIATLTGVSTNFQLTSSLPIGLRFVTDESRVYKGFEISYRVIHGSGKIAL